MSQRSEPQNDILVVASLVQRVVATANLQNQAQSTAKPSCVLSLLQISGWCTGLDICMDICTNMCMGACVDACMWTCADFKQRAGGLVVGQVHLNRNVRINNKINSRHNDGRNQPLCVWITSWVPCTLRWKAVGPVCRPAVNWAERRNRERQRAAERMPLEHRAPRHKRAFLNDCL